MNSVFLKIWIHLNPFQFSFAGDLWNEHPASKVLYHWYQFSLRIYNNCNSSKKFLFSRNHLPHVWVFQPGALVRTTSCLLGASDPHHILYTLITSSILIVSTQNFHRMFLRHKALWKCKNSKMRFLKIYD